MRALAYHGRPRSLGAQVSRMQGAWPDFSFDRTATHARWIGTLQPIQRPYKVGVIWMPDTEAKPYVFLIDPPLEPRPGGSFEQIPHLLFNSESPELSGLCLFDPDSHEWSNHKLIADTTMRWAAEWLYHYEFWLEDGIWRGKSIGYESIADARTATLHPTGV